MTDRPTTAAGRALLDFIDSGVAWPSLLRVRDAILAIEAEARPPDSEALRELADAIEAWAAGEGKFPGHRLDNALKWARSYLAALPPALDVGLPPLTPEQAEEGERRLHEAGPFPDLAALPPSAPPALDVERLGFTELLDIADALLRHYPPDTIVCSHSVKADKGSLTTAAIADLVASARLASQPEEYWTTEEPGS